MTPAKYGRAVLLLIAALVLSSRPPVSAQSERFTGTWVSYGGKTFNVTAMRPDGRFRMERFDGLKVAGTIEGTWKMRGAEIVWTYLNPRVEGEDANAIVAATQDRFSVREKDGSVSTFYRKGYVDPLSPTVLPVAPGTGWVLQDEMGEMAIRIGARQMVSGQDCYRVDWIDATLNLQYQSEYWAVKEDGVYAVGRYVGRDIPFEKPYKLLNRAPAAGEKWEARVVIPGRTENLTLTVGAAEDIQTPAGTFRAVPLTLEGELTTIRRWYASDVGLVREASLLVVNGKEKPLNLKNLKRRLD